MLLFYEHSWCHKFSDKIPNLMLASDHHKASVLLRETLYCLDFWRNSTFSTYSVNIGGHFTIVGYFQKFTFFNLNSFLSLFCNSFSLVKSVIKHSAKFCYSSQFILFGDNNFKYKPVLITNKIKCCQGLRIFWFTQKINWIESRRQGPGTG